MGLRNGVALLALLSVWAPATVEAHPLSPSLLSLEELGDGEIAFLYRTPSRRPVGSRATPELPDRCVFLEAPEARVVDEGAAIEQRATLECGEAGLAGARFAVRGLGPTDGNVLLEIRRRDGSRIRALLDASEPAFVVPEAQGSAEVLVTYVRLGVEHLMTGLDHVLFVLGLLLLLSSTRRIVVAITSFTVGHSLSLALATLGVLRLPQAPVEIAIAATLVFLGLEIAQGREQDARPSVMARYPGVASGAVGLVHGLGFASVLESTGLDGAAVGLSLLGFNLGIEAAQLALVFLALFVGWALRTMGREPGPRSAGVIAYVIGGLASAWVIERSLALVDVFV